MSDTDKQVSNIDEVQDGIFNLVITLHREYNTLMNSRDAKTMTAGYLQSLIDGLLIPENAKEEDDK